MQDVPLDHVPLAGSTPLKGRQPDFYKYQSGRRRAGTSEASPNQNPRRTVLSSPAEVAAEQAAPRKGFLNRRFKRVFAYFCRGAKVGAGRPGPRRPRAIEKNQAEAARRAAKNPEILPLPLDKRTKTR